MSASFVSLRFLCGLEEFPVKLGESCGKPLVQAVSREDTQFGCLIFVSDPKLVRKYSPAIFCLLEKNIQLPRPASVENQDGGSLDKTNTCRMR